MTFKDHDRRIHLKLVRCLIWLVAMAASYAALRYALHPLPPYAMVAALSLMGIVYLYLLWGPIELFRQLEVRPDCLIVEGEDVFLVASMELGHPTFKENEAGHKVLCGVYGTRFVEYLTTVRSDPDDRAPEVFEHHLRYAMEQLWATPGAPSRLASAP